MSPYVFAGVFKQALWANGKETLPISKRLRKKLVGGIRRNLELHEERLNRRKTHTECASVPLVYPPAV